MVHSEHILISISTTKNLYKKVSHYIYYIGYIDIFFQNYPCQRQRFLKLDLCDKNNLQIN